MTTPQELNEFLLSIDEDWSKIDTLNAEVAMLQMAKIIGKLQAKVSILAIELEVYNNLNNKKQ
jgi:hypothetical protein